MPQVSPGLALIGGVIFTILGYALLYTGVSQLSHGDFTQGNVQGLATSLGLDKLSTAATGAWQGGGGGSLDAPGSSGAAPVNGDASVPA